MANYSADPEQLISKGNKIERIYDDYMNEKKKVYATADKVATAWNDEAGRKYVDTLHSYEEDFEKLGVVGKQLGEILKRHGTRLVNSRENLTSMASKI